MADEVKNKEDDQAKDPQKGKAAPKKGKMVKYIIFGGGGMALVAAVAFVTVMLMGGMESGPAPGDTSAKVAEADASDGHDAQHLPDSLAGEEIDQDAMEMIMDNVAALDYQPEPSEIEGADIGMSREDSVEAIHWLQREKAAMADKERELDARQKELQRLDKQITQKILRIEQAESSRIANLAKLYDGMDARAVAKLMANLDDATVVSILPRMKIKNASSVLQLLPARRAAKLSKQMITIAER